MTMCDLCGTRQTASVYVHSYTVPGGEQLEACNNCMDLVIRRAKERAEKVRAEAGIVGT